MPTILEAIATGHPPFTGQQREAAAFMERVETLSAPLKKRLSQIYEQSGIDARHSCIDDWLCTDAADFTFFPNDWSLQPPPSTHARNEHYRRAVVPLAERVAREALAKAGLAPEAVTHIVAVSCTGFFAPGLDIELVKRLGLPPTTQRTLVGFMGCYAAFNALRVAHGFCEAFPGARVLVVCAELCTLHFQVEDSLESAVVNALFSDGCAAAVLASKPAAEADGQLAYTDTHTLLDDDSMEDMTWAVGDTGFLMGLSPRVPKVIARHLPAYLGDLLGRNGLTHEQVGFWAIHPGGRAIVERAQQILGLTDAQLFDSYEVLRQHGNMSSPTILFILERVLAQHAEARGRGGAGFANGVAMAFGPGLTLEGALFRQVSSSDE